MPKTLSNRAGHGNVAWSGVSMSWPATIVTGVCELSPLVRIVRSLVPTPSTSHARVPLSPTSPTPTQHCTSAAGSGRCTVSSDRSMSCAQPDGIRFQ